MISSAEQLEQAWAESNYRFGDPAIFPSISNTGGVWRIYAADLLGSVDGFDPFVLNKELGDIERAHQAYLYLRSQGVRGLTRSSIIFGRQMDDHEYHALPWALAEPGTHNDCLSESIATMGAVATTGTSMWGYALNVEGESIGVYQTSEIPDETRRSELAEAFARIVMGRFILVRNDHSTIDLRELAKQV